MSKPEIITPEVRRVIDFPLKVGESPTWDDRTGDLWLVDILAPAAICLRADGRVDRFEMPFKIGCLALCEGDDIAVALENGVHLLNPKTGAMKLLCDPDGGRPDSRLNDGKVGPDGCFWVGTRDEAIPQTGNARLYRVMPDGSFTTIVDGGLLTSNGLAWSPDGRTMYHSDSSGLFAQAFDFDLRKGVTSPPRRLHDFTPEEGRPDGAAMDAKGFYWIAGILSGGVNRLSPEGEVVEIYKMPAKSPTMPCFGSPDLATIYVTTLSTDNNGTFEHGTLFAFEAGVRGTPIHRFGI
ncbi:SMP-30/Gluconolaconase/LRE-like region-containing protein [Rhizobium sp. CF080]|uniref:SMP-30/gluconolactonase/LRE family protein n=1 Tax=Rhizobium sp. (strain CF080) TaxID=1144310 RepID=UPI000271D5B1|nr:SMP-30/gluconolactonase/LRE family protein [Rhizobium sp. CF080]EUB98934.1 SMP-30/Gluconolaconase/LRE-like region-containing protein [Rhizobium sp. CF080]